MDIIDEYVREWGPYNTLLHFMSFICAFNNGVQALVYSWTLVTPAVRCRYPNEADNATYDIPGITDWSSRFFVKSKEDGENAFCKYCPSMLLSNATMGSCDLSNVSESCQNGFVYDQSQYKNTLVTDFEMVCPSSTWKVQLAESLYMVGIILGSSICGTLADRFGRRKTYIVTTVVATVLVMIMPLVKSYWQLCLFQILIGIFNEGPYLCMFILLMEFTAEKSRSAAGLIFQTYFTLGYLYSGLVAYFFREWKQLMWVASAPYILVFLTFFFIPESYLWLASKKRVDEAKVEIKKLCKMNKIDIPEAVLDKELNKAANESSQEDTEASILMVFRHWKLAKMALLVFFTWFCASMVYYGLSLNAAVLPGSPYVNFAVMGAIEIPAYLLAIPLMNKIGRVPCLYGAFAIGGVALIISAFLPPSLNTLEVVLAVTGKMCVAAAYSIVYNYTAEVFPTVVRTSGTGFSSVCAHIGALIAPQIYLLGNYVHSWLPFLIYGTFAFSAGVLDYFLPETKDRELPQTIEDGIHFMDKRHQSKKSGAMESELFPSDKTTKADSLTTLTAENFTSPGQKF